MESTEMGISDESTLNTDTALQTDGGEDSAVESNLEFGKRAKGKGSKRTKKINKDMLMYGGFAVVSLLIGGLFAFLLRGGPKLPPPLKDCPEDARTQLLTIHRKVLQESNVPADEVAKVCTYDDPVKPSENFKKMFEDISTTTSGAASTHEIKVTRPLAKKAKNEEIDTLEAPAKKEQWRVAVAHVGKRSGRLWQNWIHHLNNAYGVTMEDIHASDEVGDEARKHMCTQMLAIMQQVHKSKMVHKKPDSKNVFLLADGTVAIANYYSSETEEETTEEEKKAEIPVDPNTDMHGLGEVMYKVLFKKSIEFLDGKGDLEGENPEEAKSEGNQVNVKFPDGSDENWCNLINKMMNFKDDKGVDWDEINKEFAALLQ